MASIFPENSSARKTFQKKVFFVKNQFDSFRLHFCDTSSNSVQSSIYKFSYNLKVLSQQRVSFFSQYSVSHSSCRLIESLETEHRQNINMTRKIMLKSHSTRPPECLGRPTTTIRVLKLTVRVILLTTSLHYCSEQPLLNVRAYLIILHS